MSVNTPAEQEQEKHQQLDTAEASRGSVRLYWPHSQAKSEAKIGGQGEGKSFTYHDPS